MRKIRLTESQFNRIVSKCVNKALNEGTTDEYVSSKLDEAKELNGADAVLDTILGYLDSDTLEDIVKWLIQDGYINE